MLTNRAIIESLGNEESIWFCTQLTFSILHCFKEIALLKCNLLGLVRSLKL